jgi:peptide-methionine (R)-S-oxide reductase
MLTRRSFALAAGIGALGALAAKLAMNPSASAAGAAKGKSFPFQKSEEEWQKILTPDQYHVLRKHGTERAFTSPLDKTYTPGTYHCAGCNQSLFSSAAKYDSGTGWPSFWEPLKGAIGTTEDKSLFMTRTEVHCANCGGHLGHVFDDGPKPTGQRYCMNGVALKFVPQKAAS